MILKLIRKVNELTVGPFALPMSKRGVVDKISCLGRRELCANQLVLTLICIIKPKQRSWPKRYEAPNSKSAQLLKRIAQSSANNYAKRSNDYAWRCRIERSSVGARKTGVALGQVVKIIVATCMIKRIK